MFQLKTCRQQKDESTKFHAKLHRNYQDSQREAELRNMHRNAERWGGKRLSMRSSEDGSAFAGVQGDQRREYRPCDDS